MAVGIKQKESVNKILKKVNHRDCLLVMKQVWCDIHLPFVAVLIKWVCCDAVPLWWHRRWMEGVWVEWNCYSCFCCKPNQVVTTFSDSWIWYNSIWLYNFLFFKFLLGGLQSVSYTRTLSQHILTYFYGMKISVLTILMLNGNIVRQRAFFWFLI